MIGAGRVAQMNLGGPLTRRHTPSLQTSVSSGLQSGSKNVYPIDLPEGFATGLSTLTPEMEEVPHPPQSVEAAFPYGHRWERIVASQS